MKAAKVGKSKAATRKKSRRKPARKRGRSRAPIPAHGGARSSPRPSPRASKKHATPEMAKYTYLPETDLERMCLKDFLEMLRTGTVHRVALELCFVKKLKWVRDYHEAQRQVSLWRAHEKQIEADYRDARAVQEGELVLEHENKQHERSLDGWKEPVFQGGELVGHKPRFLESGSLQVLERLDPTKWGPKTRTEPKPPGTGEDRGKLVLPMRVQPERGDA